MQHIQDNFPDLTIAKSKWAQDPLCDYCRTIRFDDLGFRPADSTAPIKRAEPSLKDGNAFPARQLIDVLPTAQDCVICKQAAEIFDEYKSSEEGQSAAIDIQKLEVIFSLESTRTLPLTIKEADLSCLIRIQIDVRAKYSRGSNGIHVLGARCFQKCQRLPPHLDVFCQTRFTDELQTKGLHAFEGRFRPLVANLELFRMWKDACSERHVAPEMTCPRPINHKISSSLRFIDVERRCVVEGRDGDKFFALSYLWGTRGNPCLLTTSSVTTLSQAGSLKSQMLPATVEDAIVVTLALGRQYLWVDALCVVQDDDADKAEALPRMHEIYGNAELTIVAAAGDNCHAGLPGIRPGTRRVRQRMMNLGQISIMQSLDSASIKKNGYSHLGNCKYNSRGWCFQERLLSSRCLIFSPEQVYWECQNATWCEEAYWECRDFPSVYRHSVDGGGYLQYRLPFGQMFEGPQSRMQYPFEFLYRLVVEKYSSSELTYASDNLAAFLGILAALEKGYNEKFWWGMPVSYLEHALAWPTTTILRRNKALHSLKLNDGTITTVPFPSWSWVGWIGRNAVASLGPSWSNAAHALKFYRLDEQGNIRSLNDESSQSFAEGPTEQSQDVAADYLTNLSWADENRTLITKEHIPMEVVGGPQSHSIICFWSSTCHGTVYEEGSTLKFVQEGESIGMQYYDRLPGDMRVAESADFVVVGMDSREGNKIRLNVLWVNWHDGVAYRRGALKADEQNWEKLETVWRPVILG